MRLFFSAKDPETSLHSYRAILSTLFSANAHLSSALTWPQYTQLPWGHILLDPYPLFWLPSSSSLIASQVPTPRCCVPILPNLVDPQVWYISTTVFATHHQLFLVCLKDPFSFLPNASFLFLKPTTKASSPLLPFSYLKDSSPLSICLATLPFCHV